MNILAAALFAIALLLFAAIAFMGGDDSGKPPMSE